MAGKAGVSALPFVLEQQPPQKSAIAFSVASGASRCGTCLMPGISSTSTGQ